MVGGDGALGNRSKVRGYGTKVLRDGHDDATRGARRRWLVTDRATRRVERAAPLPAALCAVAPWGTVTAVNMGFRGRTAGAALSAQARWRSRTTGGGARLMGVDFAVESTPSADGGVETTVPAGSSCTP